MHKLPNGAQSAIIDRPTEQVVTLVEAKMQSRIEDDEQDQLIVDYILAATDMVDAEFGELGVALTTQSWRLSLPCFPGSGKIILPVPPVQSVTEITFFDAENAEQTLSPSAYTMTAKSDHGCVDLVAGQSWPATYARDDAVQVVYTAGYGDSRGDVPNGIRQAIRMIVAHWYECREAASEKEMSSLPLGVHSLLMKYRVPRGHM